MECKGIITAMVTPFKDDQTIDYEATKNLVNYLIDKGVNGLFILGTNGEFYVLEEQERQAFATFVIKETAGRVPVYVGVGANATREVIKSAKAMEKIGAEALSIITPYFMPLTQEEVYNHYKQIAASTSLPIIIYNMPSKTGINVEPETITRLAAIKNIVAVKDSSGNFDNMKAYIDQTADMDFAVLSGSDSLVLKALKAGGTGGVAATTNFLPEVLVSLYQQWQAGDIAAAEKTQLELEELRRVLKFGTIPTILKEAMNQGGIHVGAARYPALMPDDATKAEVANMVQHYGKGRKE